MWGIKYYKSKQTLLGVVCFEPSRTFLKEWTHW